MAISITINKRRYKALITITAGTPIFAASGAEPIRADRLLIQMQAGAGAGMGQVYDGAPDGATPASLVAGADVPVQLAPATATAPGGAYTDTAAPNDFIDLRCIAVDGAHSGDIVLVDAHLA